MANASGDKPDEPEWAADTRLVSGGRDPFAHHGFVNPPVYHASTVLYPTADDLIAHRARYQYGRRGTPTSEALEQALQAIEGPACAGVGLLPSGLCAISTALLAVLGSGDHLPFPLGPRYPAAPDLGGWHGQTLPEVTYCQ